jgi:RimJ/RimL family protein N-acetyltransferase
MENIQIITERLILKPVNIDDSTAIFKYRSDKETNKYQMWIPGDIDEVHDYIKNKISPVMNLPHTWFQFVILKKPDNELIGDVGIHFIDDDGLQAELGCTLNRAYHGNGYALETMTEIINLLFNKLDKHRIIASIDPHNKPSIKLVERLGFRKEAHFIKSLLINNEWVDDLIYAILKSEWGK